MAISVAFLNIANTDIDAESPVTSALMTAYRDRDQFLYEWLGRNYTPAENHDHNGVNSARISGQIVRSYFGSVGSGTLTANADTDVLTVPNVALLAGETSFIWITYHGDVAFGGHTGLGQAPFLFGITVLHNGVGILTIPNDYTNNLVDTKKYTALMAHNVRYNQVRTGAMVLRINVPSPFVIGGFFSATINMLIFRNP